MTEGEENIIIKGVLLEAIRETFWKNSLIIKRFRYLHVSNDK